MSIDGILKKQSHPVWVGLQFGSVRLLTAIKFLLVAKILGPVEMGYISVALLGLASIEALTDLGLGQAIIQHQKNLSTIQRHTTWTLLLLRGAGISLLMVLLAPWASRLMGSPGAASLLFIAALIPLIRNAANVEMYVLQRDRNFKMNAAITIIPSFIDFSVSMALVLIYRNPLGIFVGQIVGEILKTILSFSLFRELPHFRMDLRSVRELNTYGRWIWTSSVIIFFLNQTDKIMAGSIFGSYQLGIYQMSTRTAQLAISDLAVASGQYLFPTFSEKNRINPTGSRKFFIAIFTIAVSLAVGLIFAGWMAASNIILFLLGSSWVEAVPIFRVLLVSAGIGGIIAVLVAYIRAIGQPKWIAIATSLQLIIFVPSIMLLSHFYGVIGLAYANVIGTFSAALYLVYRVFSTKRSKNTLLSE